MTSFLNQLQFALFLTLFFLIPVQVKFRHQSCLCVDRNRIEWIYRPLPSSINDQRAAKSKMTISKRFLLHVMFLLCDVTALAASAQVDNYVMFSSQNKDHRPADSSSVVEYHFDHEITERQARDNLRSMVESDFQTPAYCKPCSDEHKRYCHSENLLKDHCCCNQGHKKGEFVDTQFYRFFCYISMECFARSHKIDTGAAPSFHQFLVAVLTIVIIKMNIQA